MIHRYSFLVGKACLLFLVSTPLYSSVSTFNFDSDVLGTPTPFTDTNNGLSATFSSPADPGAFNIASSFFVSLTGNVLLDPGNGTSNIPLIVDFSSDVSSASLLFATDGSLPTPFVLDAYEHGVFVGEVSALGTIPNGGFFPEGSITFNTGTFNSIVLTSPDTPYFAIDDLVVNGTTTPEPSSLLLLSSGFLAAGSRLRRMFGRMS